MSADWGYKGAVALGVWWLFWGLKRLDPGSSHPTKPLRALAGTPTGRDDTVFGLMVVCFGV